MNKLKIMSVIILPTLGGLTLLANADVSPPCSDKLFDTAYWNKTELIIEFMHGQELVVNDDYHHKIISESVERLDSSGYRDMLYSWNHRSPIDCSDSKKLQAL